ncbi:hypothetical protein [Photobacterium sp. BZF1]|uniref:hypothetical protein n=1 Tax=Photobacterium sp. BZF1 TaxID=1904457 RepID=UPI001CA46A32|nr:hypothetical protein [Photobacterium sp. BZF1]
MASGHGHQDTAYSATEYQPVRDSGNIDYLDSIQISVEQGDMDKAITLLKEAEKRGVPNARETFINAVESIK